MHTKINKETLVQRAAGGDRAALEETLAGVQELVFNLSLRMLGTFHDAEDASQDILVKVMTRLSSFRGESAFDTWVFRIAVNHLRDYKKHLFAQSPLSFEFYGEDIRSGRAADVPDLTGGADSSLLAQELKLSCHVAQGTLEGEPHFWTVVQTGEGWRHLDPSVPEEDRRFHTDQELQELGYNWEGSDLPVCAPA